MIDCTEIGKNETKREINIKIGPILLSELSTCFAYFSIGSRDHGWIIKRNFNCRDENYRGRSGVPKRIREEAPIRLNSGSCSNIRNRSLRWIFRYRF